MVRYSESELYRESNHFQLLSLRVHSHVLGISDLTARAKKNAVRRRQHSVTEGKDGLVEKGDDTTRHSLKESLTDNLTTMKAVVAIGRRCSSEGRPFPNQNQMLRRDIKVSANAKVRLSYADTIEYMKTPGKVTGPRLLTAEGTNGLEGMQVQPAAAEKNVN